MALVGALAIGVNVVAGFTNRSLRAQVSALLGVDYTMGQASYDLRRLRLKGLIVRLEHSNTYVLTPDGVRVAVSTPRSTTGCYARCSQPTDHPAPLPLRQALRTLDHAVEDYVDQRPDGRLRTWLILQTPRDRKRP